jgi:predicted RNA-binding Zn-ribbon protein involved in translation (DUF1610 family)
MTEYCSEYECENCGKQLWKSYWRCTTYCSEEGEEYFCSKKCGISFITKQLNFEKEQI